MPTPDPSLRSLRWRDLLSERDQLMVAHACEYAATFSNAGIPGHNQFMLIAAMASMLDKRDAILLPRAYETHDEASH